MLRTGISADRVVVLQALTQHRNAADAVLGWLYGENSGKVNIILSNDKNWFEEYSYLEKGGGKRTRWWTFDELRKVEDWLEELAGEGRSKSSERRCGEQQNDPSVPSEGSHNFQIIAEVDEQDSERFDRLAEAFLEYCRTSGLYKFWWQLTGTALAAKIQENLHSKFCRDFLKQRGMEVCDSDVLVLTLLVKDDLYRLVLSIFLKYCRDNFHIYATWKRHPTISSLEKEVKQVYGGKRFQKFLTERLEATVWPFRLGAKADTSELATFLDVTLEPQALDDIDELFARLVELVAADIRRW